MKFGEGVEDLQFAEGEDDLLSDEQYSSPFTGTIVADVIVASGIVFQKPKYVEV